MVEKKTAISRILMLHNIRMDKPGQDCRNDVTQSQRDKQFVS